MLHASPVDAGTTPVSSASQTTGGYSGDGARATSTGVAAGTFFLKGAVAGFLSARARVGVVPKYGVGPVHLALLGHMR